MNTASVTATATATNETKKAARVAKPPRRPADKNSKKSVNYRLSPEGIAESLGRGKLSEAECVLVTLNDNCYMQAASEDWPDVKEVSLNFIRELLPFTSCREVYDAVARTAQLYSTEVICTHRSVPERKRLAYFIAQLLGVMLQHEAYKANFIKTTFEDNASTIDLPVIRGMLLEKLAPPETIDVCATYFRTELLRTEQYRHRRAEEALIRASGGFMAPFGTAFA